MKDTIAYKKTKIPWMKNIPEHWDLIKGKYVFSNRKELNTDLSENNRLSLTLKGVVNRSINDNGGLNPLDFATYQKFKKNDLVFKLIDLENINTSRVGIVHENGIMSSAYIRLIPSSKSYPKYFYYLYYNWYLQNVFNALGSGVRATMSSKDLLDISVPVPLIEEQIAIANHLDSQSKKIKHFIKKKQTFIALLKEQRQAVINKAVTKGKRVRVKNLVTINDESLSEKTDNKYQLKYIDIGNVKSDGSITEIQSLSFKDAPSRARRIVRKGDVIISTVRTYLQAITLIDFDEEDIVVSTGFAVLRPKKGINSEYLNYVLRDNKFIGDVITNSFGVSYPAINSTTLSALSVNVVLEEKEQAQIVSHIKTETAKIDQAIAKAQKEIELIKEYKEAMIAEAVLGKFNKNTKPTRANNAPVEHIKQQ